MRIVFATTTIAIIAILLLAVIGVIDIDQNSQKLLNDGNLKLAEEEFPAAIEIYESIKDVSNKDEVDYNKGLALYYDGQYSESIELLKGKKDYMLLGNAYYRLSQQSEDEAGRISSLELALDAYKDGIIDDSLNLELKYNYEFVKRLMDESSKNQENNQTKDEQGNNSDDKDKSKGEGSDDENNESSDKGNNENQNQDIKEQQSSENVQKDSEKEEESSTDSTDNESKNDKVGGIEDRENGTSDKAEVDQILRMLEEQEKESLKNNQEIIDRGKEDKNDW